eukprot:1190078-Rhodomonas_salina.2
MHWHTSLALSLSRPLTLSLLLARSLSHPTVTPFHPGCLPRSAWALSSARTRSQGILRRDAGGGQGHPGRETVSKKVGGRESWG